MAREQAQQAQRARLQRLFNAACLAEQVVGKELRDAGGEYVGLTEAACAGRFPDAWEFVTTLHGLVGTPAAREGLTAKGGAKQPLGRAFWSDIVAWYQQHLRVALGVHAWWRDAVAAYARDA